MVFDPLQLIRKHVQAIEAYQPILPFEVLSAQVGRAPQDIVKLDANENPYGPLPAVREALARMPYPHIYPDPESRSLRAALADYTTVPAECLLAGAGADELIDLIMRLFLEPGDGLLYCPPTFGMYAFDGQVNAARLRSVPRLADFSLDVAAIERAVMAERPKLVFLASPNNPDGGLVSEAALARLLELPVVVVLDEAYVEFASPQTSCISQVMEHTNLIVLRTFSKWAGLAGLRIGYGAFPASLMPDLWKIKQPYNVSQAATVAALAALEQRDALNAIRDRIVVERRRLFSGLQAVSYLEPLPSQGNFVLCRVVGRDAGALKRALAGDGIFVRYFDTPHLKNYLRVSVGKPDHTDRLLNALHTLK